MKWLEREVMPCNTDEFDLSILCQCDLGIPLINLPPSTSSNSNVSKHGVCEDGARAPYG